MRRSTSIFLPLVIVSLAIALTESCADSSGPRDPQHPSDGSDVFSEVEVGDNVTCALDKAGRAYCWGYNFDDGLSTGDTAYRVIAPRAVVGAPAGLRGLTVGAGHRCALDSAGAAFCWGQNGGGELGASAVTSSQRVARVTGNHAFASISAGGGHTCAVSIEQNAYCWGDNGFGQLGAGAALPCDFSSMQCNTSAPVEVAGSKQFIQISAGRHHTCGVTAEREAYCWGDNSSGQLGNPEIPIQCGAFPNALLCIRDTPVVVAGDLRFSQVAAGAYHTCGVTTEGKAYCWGLTVSDIAIGAAAIGNAGFSGSRGAERGSRTPVPAGDGRRYREIRAGNGVSCGVTDTQTAVCWGDNNYGQFGLGGIDPDFATTPFFVRMPAAKTAPSLNEDYHACALTVAGQIWCWGGLNWFGELGSEPTSDVGGRYVLRALPTPVVAPNIK